MELKITYEDTKFKKEDKELIDKFINLLQEKYPLKKSITIKFLGEQLGSMSTGSRTNNGELKGEILFSILPQTSFQPSWKTEALQDHARTGDIVAIVLMDKRDHMCCFF